MIIQKVNPQKLIKLDTCSTESDIYLSGDDCIKIIYDDELDNTRVEVMKRLFNLNYKECVIPKFLVSTYKSNNICGYGMEYLKDYSTLSTITSNRELTLEMRKDLINRICKLIFKLLDDDFIFIDIHQDNILYNKALDEIKLIDLDSGFYKDMIKNNMYNRFIKAIKIYLTRLCFNLLINENLNFEHEKYTPFLNIIYGMSNNSQKEFIKYLYSLNNKELDSSINPDDCISLFDEEYLNTAKKILISH